MIRCEVEQDILSYNAFVSFAISRNTWQKAVYEYQKRSGIPYRPGSVPDKNFIKGMLEILHTAMVLDAAGSGVVEEVEVQVVDPDPTAGRLLTAVSEAKGL